MPWEPGVAHVIADVFNPDGTPSQESPAQRPAPGPGALRGARHEADRAARSSSSTSSSRCETSPTGWKRYGEGTGNVYTSGYKGDPENTLIRSLRQLSAYGLDVVAANHEFSSGQFEINLWHSEALDAADRAFRFKTAVQELARMQDKLATFMAKPFNDEGGSGFHLHFSTWSDDGEALFDDPDGEDGLSEVARHAVAGVLAHAPALAALLNPTINSYKRFGPDTLAPWLSTGGWTTAARWSGSRRSADAPRGWSSASGDASANPYLATAAFLGAAYLGIRDKLEPPAKLEGYGYDTSKAEMLPGDLPTAIDALEADADLRDLLGPEFVRAFVAYKRNELERFSHWVTDWEFREYSYHL